MIVYLVYGRYHSARPVLLAVCLTDSWALHVEAAARRQYDKVWIERATAAEAAGRLAKGAES